MDQELKQRLIGAAVIIALAIIFVPMLFDGEVQQKNNQNISINIPEAGENNLEVKKFELDKPVDEAKELPPGDVELVINDSQPTLVEKDQANPITQIQQLPTNVVANQPVVSTEQPVQQKPEPKPQQVDKPVADKIEPVVTEPAPKVTSVPVVERSRPAGGLNQVYRVKLGSFSQQANAERVKSSLLQKNIKAVVEYNPGLKIYRVWSQDLYRDVAIANDYVAAVNQQKLNIGTPKVVTLKPQEVAQMASQGQMGWVVQLGSFSAKNNALELRNKVKAAGFNGFVDVITNSKGVQLYRLRIGPLMEKVDAEQTQLEIKRRLNLDGLIKNHELSQIVN